MSAGEQAISGRVLVGSHLSSLIPEIVDAYSIALEDADARQAWTDDDMKALRNARGLAERLSDVLVPRAVEGSTPTPTLDTQAMQGNSPAEELLR